MHAMHGEHSMHGGHDKHAGHDPELFRHRFWLTLLVSVPVVATSGMIMDWFGYHLSNVAWVGPVLGTFIYVWGGWPFLKSAVAEVRDRAPGMMLLIAMAITVAWSSSMASSLGWFDLEFWWELAALVTIMLLGRWQEMKAIGQARGALAALAALIPDEAELVEGDQTTTVSIAELRTGQLVLVRAGGRVPADGLIEAGEAEIDEAMITGESRPVPKVVGDKVVAGTVSTDSSIRVRVTAVGEGTALAGIQRLVTEAQNSNSRAQVLADRFAAWLFYIATGSAAVTFIAWSIAGNTKQAVTSTVTVLVIACPHALGLAIPLVISLSTAVAARNGILVKDRLALERMRTITAVLFDKTGTLTEGRHVVTGVTAATGTTDDVLRLAGGVELDSEHPVAKAIVTAAREKGPLATATDFKAITGRGVEAMIDGWRYAVGGPVLLRERKLTTPTAIQGDIDTWTGRGAAVLFLIHDEEIIGAIALEDAIRPEARQAVIDLHDIGIERVVMITGDARQVADAVAKELGIDAVFAEVLPEDKQNKVAELQSRGYRVAMVGDGVNDAPALARADVGLAIGAGTDVAIESAGVVLAGNDPRSVTGVIRLSKATYRKMRQNLAWAAGYNIIAIPLAAGALSWAGITLAPAIGAVMMSFSTIVVAINAQLLRRVELRPDASRSTRIVDSAQRIC
ncbi:MAG: heavy metal translocating P-type ATPase [Ilumatobacteraceae bacterium]|nr:heavy metal translocating P-type ATPase [Ilumatobacteraceae bacterium]